MHIQKNVSLKKYNTFGVDITCKQFICIDKEEELPYLFEDKIFDTRFLSSEEVAMYCLRKISMATSYTCVPKA